MVSTAIEVIGQLALKNKKFLGRCTKFLLGLLKNKSIDNQADDVIMSLTKIIIHVFFNCFNLFQIYSRLIKKYSSKKKKKSKLVFLYEFIFENIFLI